MKYTMNAEVHVLAHVRTTKKKLRAPSNVYKDVSVNQHMFEMKPESVFFQQSVKKNYR